MALIQQRAGRVHIRVGGNTQETATMVDSLPDNKVMQKEQTSNNNPVNPTVLVYVVAIN